MNKEALYKVLMSIAEGKKDDATAAFSEYFNARAQLAVSTPVIAEVDDVSAQDTE